METQEQQQQQQQQQQYLNEKNEELNLYFPIMQQSSIYPLTVDEVENSFCKHGTAFGSMDIDDFLSSILSDEEANITITSAADTVAIPATNSIVVATTSTHAPPQQQVSLTVPSPLDEKTVTEEWTEIHRTNQFINHPSSSSGHQRNPLHDIKSEMEEISLEDFLVQAGVVREAKPPMTSVVQHLPQLMIPEFQLPHLGPLPIELAVHGVQQLEMMDSSLSPVTPDGFRVPHFSSNSGASGGGMVAGGSRSGGRRRGAMDGGMDRVAERNQRRMIKNRESAARSRARRQAYTAELEAGQNKFREENARLREDVQLEKQKTADFMEERSREKIKKARRTHRPSVSCQ